MHPFYMKIHRKSDLVVGAPFYMDTKGGGGAVYVYLNDRGFRSNHPYVRLTGPKESRFGIALSSAGDLNKDGFEDLAVGAPYADEETGPRGFGAVYIFLGSKDGLITEAAQVRTPSTGSAFITSILHHHFSQ
jgi:integrin alpha 7